MSFGNNLTVAETSAKLKISKSTIYNRINSGEVPYERIPYPTLYRRTNLITIDEDDIANIKLKRRGRKPRHLHILFHVTKGGNPA